MKTAQYNHSLVLDLGLFGERTVDIAYDYSAGRPAVMYLRNGDPGYPEEPAELEVLQVSYNGVVLPVDFWDNQVCLDTIIDELSAYHSED